MRKIILFLGLLCSILFAKAQDSIQNVLDLKTEKKYVESNVFTVDSLINIREQVCYSPPMIRDADDCHMLTIRVIDTAAFRLKKNFDVTNDAAIIQVEYFHVVGKPGKSEKKNGIAGVITVENWKSNRLELEFSLEVYDAMLGKKFSYQGKRIFSLSK